MAVIKFYNSLTKNKEDFIPIDKENNIIGMYNCGPTVYNYVHIGNIRAYVFADTIKRIIEYNDYKTDQVINITDVGHLTDDADEGEDKLEKRANETNISAKEISQKYTDYFFNTLDLLNIDRSSINFPKATDHIEEQIEMIKKLEEDGHTYKTSDGVYFDTSSIEQYGKLGQISNEDEESRIGENKEKRNNSDFALWKFSKEDENRQQEWDSPWGVGFPGWHIECSAMSKKYLGETFDIHTGGIDHIPTHHNNEIAQSETFHDGKKQANYWLHVNHVMFDGERFAKSTGHVVYISDLEEKGISPLNYRYWILTSDYRTLVNFTWDTVQASKKAHEKLIKTLSKYKTKENKGGINKDYKNRFLESVNDDLNTAAGIAIIWELIKDNQVKEEDKLTTIYDFDRVLGLNIEALVKVSKDLNKSLDLEDLPEKVRDLIKSREEARKNKDWTESDNLRNKINSMGYKIIDNSKDNTFSIELI